MTSQTQSRRNGGTDKLTNHALRLPWEPEPLPRKLKCYANFPNEKARLDNMEGIGFASIMRSHEEGLAIGTAHLRMVYALIRGSSTLHIEASAIRAVVEYYALIERSLETVRAL
ncbi:MAG: hypothetical protein HZA90_07140 [Verrucomicrobia bacterium]|nr:hypothetical protein [Verrucomicrobiota bacterium]